MSQLSQRARDRRRDAQRAASGFTITSIRVGPIELLAGAAPAEMFEAGRFPGAAPAIDAPVLYPGTELRVRARRNAGGFARKFVAAASYVEVSAYEPPPPRLSSVYSLSGMLVGTAMRAVATRYLPRMVAGLATHREVLPDKEDEVSWMPTGPSKVLEILVPYERLTEASGRRFAQARRRGRAGR